MRLDDLPHHHHAQRLAIVVLFSDRDRPKTYRHINGYSERICCLNGATKLTGQGKMFNSY
jgi:hypothetical protein